MADTNLNALLQSMLEGMILQDTEGKIIQFNQAALNILGISGDQLTAQDLIDLERQNKVFPGKDHIGMMSLKTGEAQRNIILNIIRHDGEMRWISLNAVPIFDKEKSIPYQLVNTFTDITEVKRVLNDLKQVEFLFNISHDLMVITNQQGFFKKINPSFSEVLGHRLFEIVSQKFINFVHLDDLELTQTKLTELSERKKTTHFINRYKTKDGGYRIFDWVVVLDQETKLYYFTARDMTDYQEEELNLIQSSKVYSLGEMTSCVTFIIHNHLSVIGNHIDFIQDQIAKGPLDQTDLKSKIDSIKESVEKLSNISKGLASFSKDTTNEIVTETSLTKALEHVLNLCRERCRLHNVKLNVNLDENLIIKCREGQIAQAFIILLNVLYKEVHLQREALIELTAKKEEVEEGIVKIYLSDNATLDKDNVQKNFNIPQKIIEDNSGKFSLDTTASNTKIIIEFPLAKDLTRKA